MTDPNIKLSAEIPQEPLSIVVLGASGDLAKKKTYPALFALFRRSLLPEKIFIYGFARTEMEDAKFKETISKGLKGSDEEKKKFLDMCHYVHGQYDSEEAFSKLDKTLTEKEGKKGNRIFYLAIPPSVFVASAKTISHKCQSKTGFTRIIVEKPFGKDLASSEELAKDLAKLFKEDQLYRIDHYLGKELVQNIMVLRFGNSVFEPLWNRFNVSSVTISFKEDIGTEGRGGYFDEFGIIRDVMQNHLMQILSLVAMEPPVTLDAEDVRDEKVKLLRAMPPLEMKDLVVGQFVRGPNGKNEGYLEEKGVPKDSITPTFAEAVVFVNNARWSGVPFILKCGKALNERKAEIRIQFHKPTYNLFEDAQSNELVLRVQPNEAMYMKISQKKPGLHTDLIQSELDITYKSRFDSPVLPDAYERLLLDVMRGDHNLFVREDELEASWKIFTPALHQLEKENKKPLTYDFGSRGPAEADELTHRYGFRRTKGYVWSAPAPASKM